MKFNANTPQNQRPPLRGDLQATYDRSRANLLLVLIFTVINLFSVTFANSYFLFSATLPAIFPAVMTQMAADEEYLATIGMTPETATPLIIVGLVIGLVLSVPYLLCWIFSKKRVGWMVAALVFFSIDCLLLLISFDLTMILDIIIHAVVMYYLITGVINGFKLRDMPEDMPLPEFGAPAAEDGAPAEDGLPVFDESLFEISEENTSTEESSSIEEQEPVTARSFDEIMAENQKDGE